MEHRLSALLQLCLRSRLNTWLQWTGRKQLQDELRNILGLGAVSIRGLTVYVIWKMLACWIVLKKHKIYIYMCYKFSTEGDGTVSWIPYSWKTRFINPTQWVPWLLGPVSIEIPSFPGMGIPRLKLRRSVTPSYLQHGNPYTGKTASWYWDGPQMASRYNGRGLLQSWYWRSYVGIFPPQLLKG